MPKTSLASKVKSESRDLSLIAGDVAYTGYGFKPSTLEAFGWLDSHQAPNWGLADSALTDYALIHNPASASYAIDSYFLNFIELGGVWQRALVKSRDADGYTLTWAKSGAPTDIAYFIVRALR